MDLASLEVTIFVSLALVLLVALAALVFDLLKGNAECLREENIELRTRKDERRRLAEYEPLVFRPGTAPPVTGPEPAAPIPVGFRYQQAFVLTPTLPTPLQPSETMPGPAAETAEAEQQTPLASAAAAAATGSEAVTAPRPPAEKEPAVEDEPPPAPAPKVEPPKEEAPAPSPPVREEPAAVPPAEDDSPNAMFQKVFTEAHTTSRRKPILEGYVPGLICDWCGSHVIRRVKQRFSVRALFGFKAYRCQNCHEKFHRFRIFGEDG